MALDGQPDRSLFAVARRMQICGLNVAGRTTQRGEWRTGTTTMGEYIAVIHKDPGNASGGVRAGPMARSGARSCLSRTGVLGIEMARRVQVCVLTLALAAASGAVAAQLASNEWRPLEAGKIEVPADAGLFVRFGDEGKLEGHGGCNRFFGTYKLERSRIKIGPIGATMMECQEPIMEREKRLLQALERASQFARHGANLILYDDAGNPVVRFIRTGADKR
jgi:heat shock protein HslJ